VITLTRRLDAPIHAVWRAWTDQATFASWFWPARLDPVTRLDARQGGEWRVESAVASMAVGGTFSTIVEPEQLSFTWRWHGEADESTVSVRLAAARENSTLLDLTQAGITSESAAADLRQGWNDCLDRLPGALAGD
jgi:uncharacterized protein YndB with AHSA1/START domain